MRNINKNRSAGFRSSLEDPLSYLKKDKFLTEFIIDKESREYYLYGNRIDKIQPHIKNLLILDGAKVRDGEADDEVVLVRMKVNPGTMQYNELWKE